MSHHSDTHTELSFKWHCILPYVLTRREYPETVLWLSTVSLSLNCTVTDLWRHYATAPSAPWSPTHCSLLGVPAALRQFPPPFGSRARHPTPHTLLCHWRNVNFSLHTFLRIMVSPFLIKIGILLWLVLRNMGSL